MARVALLLANFAIGISVVGVAAMLPELARGLDVTIQQAGLLVTVGAVVLCIGSPLMVWATSRMERRPLLAALLGFLALGHFAAALLPHYGALMTLRVLLMLAAAPVTPLAASTVAAVVPEAERPGAVAFVFLGWSLAAAAGLPAVTFLAAHAGWPAVFAAIGVVLAASTALIVAAIPSGLRGAPMSLASWGALLRNRLVLMLLLLTVLHTSGQFVLFTYLAPLLGVLGGAGTATVGVFFMLFGVAGFVGNALATRLVATLKPFATSLASLLSVLAGVAAFALGAGFLVAMGIGVTLWGLGFAAINSMQQARLIAAAGALGGAAVSLNTSSLYVGQAIGSALGGFLFAHGLPRAIGYAAMAFLAVSLAVLALTRAPRGQASV